MLADAARANVELGAQIIDINMGCPAKKVCNKAAGSALLKDEQLVAEILQAVVAAVDVPVTLKIRTGWDRDNWSVTPAIGARIKPFCNVYGPMRTADIGLPCCGAGSLEFEKGLA